jgi:endo-beta-N-acetylglucosaminidase D
MIFKKCLLLIVVFIGSVSTSAHAEINNNRPPFSLTLTQVEQWSPTSIFADQNNISSVPLKKRFVAELGNNKLPLDSKVKVLIAPDGMNNLANYLQEQKTFNLYNFTHWSHIDVLNWFAGTANETVNLPARPWVETAHKNGVKVIGTVYLSVAQYGGNVETVARLLQQNSDGEFPFAKKLVAMADFYGFDGWLINPETNLTYVKNEKGEVVEDKFEYKNSALLGQKMQDFMRYLTGIAPKPMEIHWYDSMLLDGSVKWQNELNSKNSPFLQDGQQRISDAMFMNYWWNNEMVEASRDYVKKLGRSRYDMYFGADLSPARNAQRMFEQSEWLYALFPKGNNAQSNKGLSSIALFGNDVNYTFTGNKHTKRFSEFRQKEEDSRRFYDTEMRLFAGDDLNLYSNDDRGQWPGVGRFVPAKSTLTQLPFKTSFNTGHGLFKAEQGKLISGPWHDISQQDLLPTWQFAIKGNKKTSVFYDFESAYLGGNSLAIISEKSRGISTIPLYESTLLLNENSQVSITYQYNLPKDSVSLWLELDHDEIIYIPLATHQNNKQSKVTKAEFGTWLTAKQSLKHYQQKMVTRIGFNVDEHLIHDVAINIGLMEIQ